MAGSDDGLGQGGEVVAGDVGVGHQVVGHGRHEGEPADAPGADLGGHADGVGVVHQVGGGASEERPQGAEHQHVEDGQRQGRAVALIGDGGVGPSAGDARPQQVVLGVHGALGATGGTRGIGNGRRSMWIYGRRRRRVAGIDQIGPGAGSVGWVDHQDRSTAGRLREGSGALGGGHQQGGPGVVELPGHLVVSQVCVHAQPDGTQSLGGQEGLDEGDPVGQRAGHHIAGSHAAGCQAASRSVHPGVQFGIGEPDVAVAERRVVGMVADAGHQGLGCGGRSLGERRWRVADHEAVPVHGRQAVQLLVSQVQVGHLLEARRALRVGRDRPSTRRGR